MNVLEVKLESPQVVQIGGADFNLAREDFADRNDALRIAIQATGEEQVVVGGVDVSQQIPHPRVHVIRGAESARAFIFGGEKAVWLADGRVDKELTTYRDFDYTEYWVTHFFETAVGLLIAYEFGLLLLDQRLNVKWHRFKYLTDYVRSIDQHAIFLVSYDEEHHWEASLEDGSGEGPPWSPP
jgi:hypothetical protein